MNWLQAFGSKRTQATLVAIAPSAFVVFQALVSRQPIPFEHCAIIVGGIGLWCNSDAVRPTVKPATVADFAEIQRILADLQANLSKPDEVAK
jgi:DNA-binding transcriptional regulator YdaS (Cro superfamily)